MDNCNTEAQKSVVVGDKVIVSDEVRTITKLIRNINNNVVILWEAKNSTEGACPLSIWQEWRQGIPQNKRREI